MEWHAKTCLFFVFFLFQDGMIANQERQEITDWLYTLIVFVLVSLGTNWEEHMKQCCLHSLEKKHLPLGQHLYGGRGATVWRFRLAQKNYLDLIHGSKTWVTGGRGSCHCLIHRGQPFAPGLLYISSDEPKGNERMWGQKWRKIDDKAGMGLRISGCGLSEASQKRQSIYSTKKHPKRGTIQLEINRPNNLRWREKETRFPISTWNRLFNCPGVLAGWCGHTKSFAKF